MRIGEGLPETGYASEPLHHMARRGPGEASRAIMQLEDLKSSLECAAPPTEHMRGKERERKRIEREREGERDARAQMAKRTPHNHNQRERAGYVRGLKSVCEFRGREAAELILASVWRRSADS